MLWIWWNMYEYVNIGERFNMFLRFLKCQICWVIGVIWSNLVIWWFKVRIYFRWDINRCLRIMVPLFTNSTRNLVAGKPSAVVGCCIALHSQGGSTTGQLSIWQSMAGRSGLAVWSGLIHVDSSHILSISIPKLGLQMLIQGLVLMCFSSLVAHSSAPQPCWIKTTYFFLHVGCSPCMAPGFVKAKRAVALGLGLNIGITHRWKRHHGADALPPIAMNFGTLVQ